MSDNEVQVVVEAVEDIFDSWEELLLALLEDIE